ncbi:uncharacterized protein MELLADRAFT_105295 [Melampsora larici-populina 98AG31]|uniref:Uncharacterized protein n=1 Tax=Melampsora larici-populina (strain 98AG31 / pathotype 3-4-7) TaxID=747676 RepID=F4RHM9_MELLP|nr:uncharacterized protein MELLADRAFT_105295 [Melampsora larici-populina 98AG31]EGG07854.1 hypothetical protein MELLADRAFT_105295 [Melampsora larici-populina 98AG31]
MARSYSSPTQVQQRSSSGQPPSRQIPSVIVPYNPNAMQVDVNALQTRQIPSRPSRVGMNYYRNLCQERAVCYKCLKAYDSSHQTAEGRPAGCPNPGASVVAMDAFVANVQRESLSTQSVSAVNTSVGSVRRPLTHQINPPRGSTIRSPVVNPVLSLKISMKISVTV